jgi:CRP-like cAMP-binding protein
VDGTVVLIGVAVPVLSVVFVRSLRTADATNAATASSLALRVSTLAGTDLFAPCTTATLERLAAQASTRTVAADEVVLRQGDEADDLYVVLEGSLSVSISGQATPVRNLGAGDAFGEIGLVTGGARTATVTAATAAELLRIPGELFVECVQSAPPLAEVVGGVVASRLARTRPRPSVASVPVGSAS